MGDSCEDLNQPTPPPFDGRGGFDPGYCLAAPALHDMEAAALPARSSSGLRPSGRHRPAVVRGTAGLGKTYTIKTALARRSDVAVCWATFPSRPTMRSAAASLFEALSGLVRGTGPGFVSPTSSSSCSCQPRALRLGQWSSMRHNALHSCQRSSIPALEREGVQVIHQAGVQVIPHVRDGGIRHPSSLFG